MEVTYRLSADLHLAHGKKSVLAAGCLRPLNDSKAMLMHTKMNKDLYYPHVPCTRIKKYRWSLDIRSERSKFYDKCVWVF